MRSNVVKKSYLLLIILYLMMFICNLIAISRILLKPAFKHVSLFDQFKNSFDIWRHFSSLMFCNYFLYKYKLLFAWNLGCDFYFFILLLIIPPEKFLCVPSVVVVVTIKKTQVKDLIKWQNLKCSFVNLYFPF